jgi:hypothetical protein
MNEEGWNHCNIYMWNFCLVGFPKLDVILDYFDISPLNNRRAMTFFKSAVHQAIEMRDEGDKVFDGFILNDWDTRDLLPFYFKNLINYFVDTNTVM